MGITKSWKSIRYTPKCFIVDESSEDYKFKAKLIKIFDKQIIKEMENKMAINKKWDDIESTEEFTKLPETNAEIVAHVVGFIFKDNEPDNPKFKNYKEGDTSDIVTTIYEIIDNEENFPTVMYTEADGTPRVPTGESHVFKCGFPEKVSFNDKSKHMKSLKLISQDNSMSEETLRLKDFAKVYEDLIGMPVYASLKLVKSGEKEYLNMVDITKGVKLTKKVYTEAVDMPKFLLEDKEGNVIHDGTITIADVLEG